MHAISNPSIVSKLGIDNATSPMIFDMFVATIIRPVACTGFMHSRVNRNASDIKKPAAPGYKFSKISIYSSRIFQNPIICVVII